MIASPATVRRVASLVAGVLLANPVSATPTRDAFASIPNVTIAPYLVEGDDALAVRRSIDARRPTDAHDGTRVDAVSSWDMRWSWPRTRGGGCDLRRATIRYTATVRLPRLAATARLTPAERTAWDRYLAALMVHEAGHVAYTYDRRSDVLAAIRSATCATADRAASTALAAIDAYHIAYDRETGHGATQGASFP